MVVKKNTSMDISIIMPAYNTEKYIAQAIDSVLEQKGLNIELIVINDGSIDNTLKIIQEKQKKYKNLKLITEENSGLSYARKEGLDVATGKYIYFVDSDDFLVNGSLKYMFETCEKYNLDCLMINAKFKSEIDNDYAKMMADKTVVSKKYPKTIITGEQMLENMIKNREWRYAVWLYFVKKDLLNEIDFFKNIIHEDSGYNYQLLNKIKRMKYINIPLYNYRIRPNSIMTKQISLDNINGYINSYKVIYELNNKKKFKYENLLFEMRILDQIIECFDKLDDKDKELAYQQVKEIISIVQKRNNYYIDKYRDFFNIPFTNKFENSKIKYLEIDITDHCNLNCENCIHFAQLAKPAFMPIFVFEQDIKRISELSGGSIGRLVLMGGEPLLNPNIIKYMKIARKYLSNTDIQLLSNGILINKMPEKFWQYCKKNNIQINITPYPINIDYYSVYNKILSHGVKLFIYDDGITNNKQFDKYVLDESGSQDIIENYKNCLMGHNYLNLKNGKLYMCPIMNNISRYNSYYNKSFIIYEDDYINIYEDINIEDIHNYLSKPTHFCKYCDLDHTKKVLWRRFEK